MKRNPLLTREYYQALYKFRKQHPNAIPNVIGVSSGVVYSKHQLKIFRKQRETAAGRKDASGPAGRAENNARPEVMNPAMGRGLSGKQTVSKPRGSGMMSRAPEAPPKSVTQDR